MARIIYQVTPPATRAASLEYVKRALRIDHDDDDELIADALDAAISLLDGREGELRRCIVHQTWAIKDRGWPCMFATLPFDDIVSLAVSYLDPDGVRVNLDPEQYYFDRLPLNGEPVLRWASGFVFPATKSAHDAVVIECVTGLAADDSVVPANLKRAIAMITGALLEHPEGKSETGKDNFNIPYGADRLMQPYRRMRF